jgi:hypothetical protein
MTDETMSLILGMPRDEGKREELARQREANGHGYMKPIIWTGAEPVDCEDCGMELWVGPRSMAAFRESPRPIVCPWCAGQRAVDAGATVVGVTHMGNPEDTRGKH